MNTIAYKGFDANLQCRGFQFEVGKTYTHEGEVKACKYGFHAVDGHPLSVFNYYPPAGSRFCIVEIDGKQSRDGKGDKVAAEILTVTREIGLHDLATEAVKWVMERAKPEGPVAVKDNGAATASGYQGAASASGDHGAASASGDHGAATASGYQGAATASGYQGAASASGYHGAATASGYHGAASASGYHGAATASGYQGAASASGYHGAASASGYLSKVKGTVGNALFSVERETWDGPIVSVACGVVGMDGIEPDVWYRAVAGKMVKA